MNLLIDLGNTRIKMALDNSTDIKLITSTKYTQKSLQDILLQIREKISHLDLKNIYFASVAGERVTKLVADNLCNTLGVKVQKAVTTRDMSGLENAYSQPETLGVDRWLALIAALDLCKPPICVVDCGTAVTIDTIDDKGIFIGGLIVPGLGLMRNVLNKNTNVIGQYGQVEEKNYFPKNTVSAVTAGTGLSIAALVEKTMQRYEETQAQKISCVITGGDGEVVKSYMDVESIYHPNLVLQGLAKYFRSN